VSATEVAAAVRQLPPLTDAQAVRIAALLDLALARARAEAEGGRP
jgi:hypothetical protein